jgi:hypothetical protein
MPDLQVFVARRGYHGLLIELKDPGSPTRARGSVTLLQKMVIHQLNSQGYHACVCWGFPAAKDLIRWYLEEDNAEASIQ